MKKWYFLALIALIGFAFSSCENMGKKQTEFLLSDLQGRWQEDGKTHYVVYTTEAATDRPGFFWGKEWTEPEKYEDRLVYHGNGWFMYQLDGTTLRQYNVMDNQGSIIPKNYTVQSLSSTKMVYYEEDYKNIKYTFTKQ